MLTSSVRSSPQFQGQDSLGRGARTSFLRLLVANALGRPFYGIRARVRALADAMPRTQGKGPDVLAGYGGVVGQRLGRGRGGVHGRGAAVGLGLGLGRRAAQGRGGRRAAQRLGDGVGQAACMEQRGEQVDLVDPTPGIVIDRSVSQLRPGTAGTARPPTPGIVTQIDIIWYKQTSSLACACACGLDFIVYEQTSSSLACACGLDFPIKLPDEEGRQPDGNADGGGAAAEHGGCVGGGAAGVEHEHAEQAVPNGGGSAAASAGSTQGTPARSTDEDPFVLHMPAGDTGLWSTYNTLDDVRARLKVLADRKKKREEAGLVTPAGRQLAETLMKTEWSAMSPVSPVPASTRSPHRQSPPLPEERAAPSEPRQ
jgi:hypothetical protein